MSAGQFSLAKLSRFSVVCFYNTQDTAVPLTKIELKDIQSLQTKKGRKLKNSFVAEGVRLLEEAVRNRIKPSRVCYSEAALSDRGRWLVDEFLAAKIRTEPIPLKQMESIADTETTQGILAIFPMPTDSLAELYRPTLRRLLLCENISDPGNLGTLLRSSRAFGIDLVILAGRSADPYSPKVVRASAGAIFGLPIALCEVDEVRAFVIKERILMLAADINGRADLRQVSRQAGKRTIMLAIGSEADGLSDELLAESTARVRIIHSQAVESLNAAIAGSILMHEMYNLTA